MQHNHIVSSYDDELLKVETLILSMSSTAEQMLEKAVTALCTADGDLATKVIQEDQKVNTGLNELTERAQKILALRSPLANDLRAVISAIQVSLNLERVGDLAKNIAKLGRKHDITISDDIRSEIEMMAKRAQQSVHNALSAYRQNDTQQALEIHQNDQHLDAMHKKLSKQIILDIKASPDDIDATIHLLFVSRHLERIGDHAKNIAEAAIFKVDGVIYEPED